MKNREILKAYSEFLRAHNCSTISMRPAEAAIVFLANIPELQGQLQDIKIDEGNEKYKRLLRGIRNFFGSSNYNSEAKESTGNIISQIVVEDLEHKEPKSSLIKLLYLVIKISLQCSQKEKYIATMMSLSESSQAAIMELIQGILRGDCKSPRDEKRDSAGSMQFTDLVNQLLDLEDQKYRMTGQIQALSLEVTQLKQELGDTSSGKQKLEIENQSLLARIVQQEKILQANQQKIQGQFLALINTHEQKIAKLNQQNRENLAEMSLLSKQKAESYSRKLQLLEQKIAQRDKRIQEQDETNEQLLRNLTEYKKKIVELESENSDLTSQLKKCLIYIEEIEQVKDILQDELNTTNNRLEDLKLMMASQCKFKASSSYGGFEKLSWMNNSLSTTKNQNLDDTQAVANKNLRIKIENMKQEMADLKKKASENKELKYENKRLHKILKEYEGYRGEENEIMLGCMYELKIRFNEMKDRNSRLSTDFEDDTC